ncbi:MAG: chemotaxis protein CheA [Armatimonadota bacterium]|nr:chemotaxis protein CheA [Armatimonadota bacterium]
MELTAEERTLFIAEAEEHIANLESGLLRLEQGGDGAVIAELFRSAHTLKGSAGAAGLTGMSQLAHAMENLLDQVRNGTKAVTAELIDALLMGVDFLRAMVVALRQNTPLPDAAPLIRQLTALAQQTPNALQRDELAAPSQRATEVIVTLNIFIKPECPMPAARAFQAYLAMSRYGEVVSLEPPVSEIQAGRAKYRLDAQVRFPDEAALAELERELSRFDDVVVEMQRQQEGQRVREIVVPPSAAETPTAAPTELQSVRVSVEQMDALLNLVGELVIERARLERGVRRVTEFHGNGIAEELQGVTERISRIVGQLQEALTRTRMVPLSVVFGRFPRLVRELARSMGKRVQLRIEGEDTEIDRALVEKLNECLVHLVRNALDHGIEPPDERIASGKPPEGVVELVASQSEGSVIVVVRDDGRGIDPDKVRRKAVERGWLSEEQAAALSDDDALRLIFRPGFSTKEQVSEVSGRGVGMDVVKNALEQIGGTVDIQSTVGGGTTVTLRLPLTLAIIPALLVRVAGRLFALPMHSVAEVLDLRRETVQVIGQGERVLMLRGEPLPLWSLAHLLGATNGQKETTAVIVRQRDRGVAVSVEGVEGKDEIVIKPLGFPLHTLRTFLGATILGDGSVALIVDLNGVLARR